ncbi:hypothetical protein [Haladaptatus sp. DFWS20]|uniref:hypothetical protein n=1 Tax=Haladaptatus sp. DFWS20 TaxID=3403467 RepID=UPI003EBFD26E
MKRTAALVGATGGAGTTRLCVELGAILTHAGRDVVIFDAAFATQGQARHAPGRIDTDLTALLTDDHDQHELADVLIDHPVETPGRLALCPTYAPSSGLRARRGLMQPSDSNHSSKPCRTGSTTFLSTRRQSRRINRLR